MADATAEQRVFSLILALLTTGDRGSTKQTLLATVYGYAETYERGGDNATLERKFERDKEQLRELGIPLETFTPYDSDGNNRETHYRIRKSVLQIPESVTFTDEELRMLSAAALVWQEGALSVEARRALMKLGSLSGPLEPEPVQVVPSLMISEPQVPPVRQAMLDGRSIVFDYAKPGDAPTRRHVAPLRLHRADRRWHLIAFDYDRDDYRTFLFSRMSGPVKRGTEFFDEVIIEGAEAVESELRARASEQRAVIHVATGSRADHRLRPRAKVLSEKPVVLEVHTLDHAALAEELIGYGADVSVTAPEELREHLLRILETTAAAHTGETR